MDVPTANLDPKRKFDTSQMPLGTKHRHQECDDRCVGRLEGIAEPTYDKEIEVETTEWQPIEARSDCGHSTSPESGS
jgi:hypothetical protein